MSSSQSSSAWRLIGAILLVLLLIVLWMMGRGPNQAGCCGDVVAAAPVPTPAPPVVAAPPAAVPARVLAQYDGGKVTLVGEVSSDAEKKRLVDAAIASYGAGNVIELLTVKSGLTALDKVTLTGNVPSDADKTARGDAAGKTFAPALIDNQFLVTAPAPVVATPAAAPAVAEAKAPDCGKAMQLRVSFATGSAIITPQGKRYLDAVVQCVKGPMLVGGHTDNVGSEALNAKLSAARANAVKTYLVSKGVKSDLLSTQGFGASKPVAKNSTAAGRASNRRIELSAK
jgi:outer membrane protein OmpA-like peptidoglycan-associated protein